MIRLMARAVVDQYSSRRTCWPADHCKYMYCILRMLFHGSHEMISA